MKLRMALLVFFSSTYFFSQAQLQTKAQTKEPAQTIQLGLTGGLTFNNISGNGMSAKFKSSVYGGGYALLHITSNLSIQPEVLYNSMSVARSNFTTFYVDNSRADSKENFNVAYVSIPLLINYKLFPKLTINAGPQYNILVSSDENLMYNKQAFKNYDFGIRGGLQYAASPNISFFGSYYNGLSNVNNIDDRYKWITKQVQIGIDVALFNAK